MRRTFSAKHNAIFSRVTFSWGTFALLFAVVIFILRTTAPDAFWVVAAPALKVSEAANRASGALFSGFGDSIALTKKVSDLATENAALSAQNRTLTQKVADLTALAGTSSGGRAGVVAGVIARPPESPYDTLAFSAGDDDGVSVGMEAFGDGGIPLGFVTAVAGNASRVTLFSAPGMKTEGWIGSAKTPVTIEGRGGGVLGAFVSRTAAVTEGDPVYVPGPGALPIGTVVRIDSDPASPSLDIRIQPALNLYAVTWAELRDTGRARMSTFSTTTPL